MIEYVFVCHLESASQRWEKFKDDNSYIKWKATSREEVSEELDKKMISFWNLPRQGHLGKCGCYDSHYRLYKHIVKNKLNDVLILEDDAVKLGEYPEDYPSDCITYLGGWFHSNKMTDKTPINWVDHKTGINICDGSFCILMTMCYIIPRWEIAEDIIKYLDSFKRLRAIDTMLCRIPIKKAYVYPAVIVEEETSSLLRTKQKKTNIYYQAVKWGSDYTVKAKASLTNIMN